MLGGECVSQGRWTALIRAAMNSHADCARLLIDAGADKEAKTNVRFSCCC
jgi:ankyrin repeat protein